MSEINIDSTYGVIIIQDLNAVYVDQQYARIYGYDTAEQLLSSLDSFLDLINPELHDIARQNYIDTISGKMTPRGHTFANIDRNGRKFTIFSIDHVIEWQGKPALQVTVVDLTPLEEVNKQARENHQQYRNLTTQSTLGILVHRNFTPLFVNESWARIMGAESIDFVMSQGDILDRVSGEFKDEVIARNKEILSGSAKQTESRIVENNCYDGKKRFFNAYDTLIDWDGSPAVQVILEDVTERIVFEKELLYKATHDQLTDLLNRSAIYDWLEDNYKVDKPMACLLIDIDDFKSINDSYGHHKGDQVIQRFARILKEIVGEQGIAGRWGGEEFIAFLPELSMQQVIAIAEQIIDTFSAYKFSAEGHSFNSTVSIGVGETISKPIKKIRDLVKEADSLLYRAKHSGKNCIHY